MNTFHPHICTDIEVFCYWRNDSFWNRYITPSTKGKIRQQRRAWTSIFSYNLPKNWEDLLRDLINKNQLFSLLETLSINTIKNMQVISTTCDEVNGNITAQRSYYLFWKEQDTRIILYRQDMLKTSAKHIIKRTVVVTDVSVLAIAYCLSSQQRIWIECGLHLE